MPHINISRSEKGNNKGSSRDLAMYLEKENEYKKQAEKELWFNQERKNISVYETIRGIDNNRKGLKQDEAKFYLVNISPSKKEISTLGESVSEIKDRLKEYAREAMADYAKNYKLKSGKDVNPKDLVWYGKIEENRYYKVEEKEVKNGLAKIGDKKPGENYHAQVIISHRDRQMKISLSPLTNDRERFSLLDYKQRCENTFDRMMGYQRLKEESLKYLQAYKNGSIKEKALLSKGNGVEKESNFLLQVKQVRSNDWKERKANLPIKEKKKYYYDLQLGLQIQPKPNTNSKGKPVIMIDFTPYRVRTSETNTQKFSNLSAALTFAGKQKAALIYNVLKSNKVVASALEGKIMMHQEKDKSMFKQKIGANYKL